jgi:site-specific DNA recombinase
MHTQLAEGKIITEMPATLSKTGGAAQRKKLRVAAYCRVSTDSEEQLNSYRSQIDYFTAVINENPNWMMAGIFADEGLSGVSTKKRKEFNKMITDFHANNVPLKTQVVESPIKTIL